MTDVKEGKYTHTVLDPPGGGGGGALKATWTSWLNQHGNLYILSNTKLISHCLFIQHLLDIFKVTVFAEVLGICLRQD